MSSSRRRQRNDSTTVSLRKPLERVIAHGHPWVYRDALESFRAEPGEVLTLLDRRGRFLARGLAEAGPIGMRVFTRRDEAIDSDFLYRRLEEAFDLREHIEKGDSDAYRLVHGEGDRLPGVVCDRYGPFAVLKLDGEGIRRWLDPLRESLRELLPGVGVDSLILRAGRGEGKTWEQQWGREVPPRLPIREEGMTLLVDLHRGQKTGLFLDHRPARRRVRALARGKRALNLFGYTGGFSVAAGLGGAREVVTVDVAPAAIELAEASWSANGLAEGVHEGMAMEVERYLGSLGKRRFDLVVADPPSFAPREDVLKKALGAYKALHRAALEAVAPGGWYLAASCSSHVDRSAFEQTVREGAHGARRALQVVSRWGAGEDHPIPLGFPEGEYLKSVLTRVWR